MVGVSKLLSTVLEPRVLRSSVRRAACGRGLLSPMASAQPAACRLAIPRNSIAHTQTARTLSTSPVTGIRKMDYRDALELNGQLTEDERMVRDGARECSCEPRTQRRRPPGSPTRAIRPLTRTLFALRHGLCVDSFCQQNLMPRILQANRYSRPPAPPAPLARASPLQASGRLWVHRPHAACHG